MGLMSHGQISLSAIVCLITGNHWYRFRKESASNNPRPTKSLDTHILDSYKAWGIKMGQIDTTRKSQGEKMSEQIKLGSRLVSLHRDAVAHPYEKALEEIEMVSKVWPIDLSYIVSVLTVNYPVHLPHLAENIAISGENVWNRFAFGNCFPRPPGYQKDRAVKQIIGLRAFFTKILPRFASI